MDLDVEDDHEGQADRELHAAQLVHGARQAAWCPAELQRCPMIDPSGICGHRHQHHRQEHSFLFIDILLGGCLTYPHSPYSRFRINYSYYRIVGFKPTRVSEHSDTSVGADSF